MAASFVESATLKLNQKTALKNISAVNRELLKLNASAKKIKKSLSGLDLDRTLRTESSTQDLRSLNATLLRTEQRIGTLRRAAARPITVKVNERSSRTENPAGVPIVSNRPPDRGDSTKNRRGFLGNLHVRELIVYAAAATIISQAARGYARADIADTRVALQALSASDQALFDRRASQTASNVRGLNLADVRGLMAETLVSTGLDVEASADIVPLLKQLIDQQVGVGENLESAIDSAFKFIKAGEQRNILTDEQGIVQTDLVQRYINQLRAAASVIGREFDADFVQGAGKYLSSSRFSISPEEFYRVLLLNEEMGTRASVGYGQAIKQLSGIQNAKYRNQNLADLGLLSLEEYVAGSVGEEQLKLFKSGGAVDEDLLRTSLSGYLVQNLIPALEKAGVDTANQPELERAIANIVGARTAPETLVGLILRDPELEKQVQEMLRREGIIARGGLDVAGQSGIAALTNMANEFQGLLGQLINSFEGVLIPSANFLADVFSKLAEVVQESSPIALVAGGAAAGYAGLSALKRLNPLYGSAVALDGSAAALTRAAYLLGGSSAVDLPGGGGGKRGGGIKSLGARVIGWGAVAAYGANMLLGGSARSGENVEKYAGVSDNPTALTRWLRGEGSSARYSLSNPMGNIPNSKEGAVDATGRVLANVIGEGMIMRASDWGVHAGEALGSSFVRAADTLAESMANRMGEAIRYAIDSSSIKVAGVSAATMGDVGLSTSGDTDATFGAAGGWALGR